MSRVLVGSPRVLSYFLGPQRTSEILLCGSLFWTLLSSSILNPNQKGPCDWPTSVLAKCVHRSSHTAQGFRGAPGKPYFFLKHLSQVSPHSVFPFL